MIALAEHGYFWLGAERVELPDGNVASAGEQMYVEHFVPAERRHEPPLDFVHGGGGQAVAFLCRGDGSAAGCTTRSARATPSTSATGPGTAGTRPIRSSADR